MKQPTTHLKQAATGVFKRGGHFLLLLFVYLVSFPVWAELPTPPSGDQANSTNDWIDVGGSMATRALKIALMLMGALILAVAAGGLMKAYHTAHEKQDLSLFFKWAAVLLVLAALGGGLIYAGYIIVSPT
jgi:hypothetical protein